MLKKIVFSFLLFSTANASPDTGTIGSLPIHPVRPATSRGPQTGHGYGHKMQIVTAKGNLNFLSTFKCESRQRLHQPQCCRDNAKFECRHLSEAFWVSCPRGFSGGGIVITPSFVSSTSEKLPRPLWNYGVITENSKCVDGWLLVDPLLGKFAKQIPEYMKTYQYYWPKKQR
jgi:hypothetical protein